MEARKTYVVWSVGDRVWYEPSPGVRFAGTIHMVPSEDVSSYFSLKMCTAYSLWKNRGYGASSATVSAESMTPRFGIALDCDESEVGGG